VAAFAAELEAPNALEPADGDVDERIGLEPDRVRPGDSAPGDRIEIVSGGELEVGISRSGRVLLKTEPLSVDEVVDEDEDADDDDDDPFPALAINNPSLSGGSSIAGTNALPDDGDDEDDDDEDEDDDDNTNGADENVTGLVDGLAGGLSRLLDRERADPGAPFDFVSG
jgi:hypothetical protein